MFSKINSAAKILNTHISYKQHTALPSNDSINEQHILCRLLNEARIS